MSPGRLRSEGPSEEGSREEYGGLTEARWRRLIELLEPFHRQAAATARRLCRSPADGDDLYQEAVLRAYEKLQSLVSRGMVKKTMTKAGKEYRALASLSTILPGAAAPPSVAP